MLQEIKACLTFRRPKKLLVLLQEISDRLCNLGEVLDKAATIACQTKELSDILWRKSFNNGLDIIRIDSNAFFRNDMPKIGDLRKPKLALGELGIEATLAKL